MAGGSLKGDRTMVAMTEWVDIVKRFEAALSELQAAQLDLYRLLFRIKEETEGRVDSPSSPPTEDIVC